MTYLELRTFIVQASSVETVDLFDQCVEIFDKYNLDEYMDIFDNTIGFSDQSSDQTIMDDLIQDANTLADKLLTEQGVTLLDITPFKMKLDICEALFDIESYIDKDHIYYIADSSENSSVAIGSIIELLTPYSCETIMSYIESINEYLIHKIKECTLPEPEESKDFNKAVIEKYKKYKIAIDGKVVYSDKFLDSVQSIELDYDSYLSAYVQHIKDIIENPSMKDILSIAQEIVGIAIMSNDKRPLITVIREKLNVVTDNIKIITELDVAITRILSKV